MEARKLEKKYTIADYEKWEGDWELWDGIPVQLYPPHPEEMTGFRDGVSMSPSPIAPHQIVVTNIARQLGNAIEAASCDCVVVSELDWQVSDTSVVRPDASVVCPPLTTRYIEQPPQLIVEALSPSTTGRDLEWKRELYERSGVGHYLVIDVLGRQIEVLRHRDGRYVIGKLSDLELHPGCRIALDPDPLWRGLPDG